MASTVTSQMMKIQDFAKVVSGYVNRDYRPSIISRWSALCLVFAAFFFFFFFLPFFCIGEDGTEVSVFVIHFKEYKITYFTRTNSTTSTTTCHKELPNLKFSMFGTPNLEFLNVWHGNLEFSLLLSPILEFSISGPPHVEFQCLA